MPAHAHTHRHTPMKMWEINSELRGEAAMTLKFILPVVKDQTRNLMKTLDVSRLDLRVRESAQCHVINAGDGGGGTIDKWLPFKPMKFVHPNSVRILYKPNHVWVAYFSHTKSGFFSRFWLFLDSCRFQLLNFVCDITTNPENQFVSKCQMPCTHIIYTCELYSQLYSAMTSTFCVVGVVHCSTDIPYTHVYVITALFFQNEKEDPISCQGSLLRLFCSAQNSI